jgi:uncharacterized membrane protein
MFKNLNYYQNMTFFVCLNTKICLFWFVIPGFHSFRIIYVRTVEMMSIGLINGLLLRNALAFTLAIGLSVHGYSKNSLSISGSIAAFFVGFVSFSCSYRFGIMLILFYYSSSKLTKWKQDLKAKLEEDYAVGGQRNWMQVFASSILATLLAVAYYKFCGEDQHINFGEPDVIRDNIDFLYFKVNRDSLASILWAVYISHYATANADTWASELGILSNREPRLVTSLFLRTVPRGTNGGMSVLGTLASAAGGLFIGIVFWCFSFILEVISLAPTDVSVASAKSVQYPVLLYSLLCGLLGSLVDSILGATLQATYYSVERKCIVKTKNAKDSSVVVICGMDVLSNEAVNVLSIFITMVLSVWLAPTVFCWSDASQCYVAEVQWALFQKFLRMNI